MNQLSPRVMIALGFVMVIVGFIFSFLMVLRIIEPSYGLSFVSYAVSFFGLFMGLIGVALYRRSGGRRG